MTTPPTAAAAARLDAPIVGVEVFRSSAVVRRRGTLAAAGDGHTHLELLGLPLALVDGSVRAAVAPPGACAVADLQVALDVTTPVEQHDVAERTTLKRLLREHRTLQQQREILEEEIAQLLQQQPIVPPLPRGADSEWFPTDDPTPGWFGLMATVRELVAAKQQHLHETVVKVRALRDELKRAEDALVSVSTASTDRLRVSKKILLRIDSPPREPCSVELSYQVEGARWFPTYELRFEPSGERAELTISAFLGQVTGEDWSAVQLSLSTADLRRRSDLPRLPALRIGRARDPQRRPAWRPLPDDLDQLFTDFDEHRPAPSAGEADEHAVTRVHRPIDLSIEATREYHAVAGVTEAVDDDDVSWAVAEEPVAVAFGPEEITHDEDAGLDAETLSGLAAPPPPPRSAPAPARARAATPPAAPYAPGAAAAYEAAGAVSPASYALPARGAYAAQALAEPRQALPRPDGPVVGDELLSFSGLVLPDAAAPDRGKLRPARRRELLPDDDAGTRVVEAEARLAEDLLQLRTRPLPRWARPVEQSAGHFAHRYETPAPARVPADGQLHRVTIARESVPVTLCYRTVPRVEPAVYRLATLANPLGQPLLAGPLDILWGNDFLVTASLDTTAAEATIEANLGVEPRVRVARNVTHSEHEAGLLAGRVIYEEQVDVELKNGLGRPAVVEVIERIPVTEEKKLDVKLVDEHPRGSEYTQQERQRPIRGGRRYRVELAADAQERVMLRYAMTLPAGNEIAGGGRRA